VENDNRPPRVFVRTSRLSGVTRERTLHVYPRDVVSYQRGVAIQDCFPYLNADDREFIMTGITPDEWERAFK